MLSIDLWSHKNNTNHEKKITLIFIVYFSNRNFTNLVSLSTKCNAKFDLCELENRYYTISDNGVGVTEADWPYVFDNQYNGSDAYNKNITGAGLGLNLCKEIVTLFNWSIDAECPLNKGTKIIFSLPLQIS